MIAREILLKHLNKGKSDNIKALNNLVDWGLYTNAMEEYAEMQVKKLSLGVVADELCECGGSERIALDCTMKPCKHPKYYNK